MTEKNLILGLGNPGERYARNRHNAGFMVLDLLAQEGELGSWLEECGAMTGCCRIAGKQVILAKPLTYMNRSGEAAVSLVGRYELPLQSVVVVLDDVNLPFGTIRVRARGSAGGHRGLESILETLCSAEVPRLRLGVGEENMPPDLAEFVLTDFPAGSEEKLEEMISRACSAVKTILDSGISRAMSAHNSPISPEQGE